MGKTGKKNCLFFQYYLYTLLYEAELVLSRWKFSTRWSTTAHATIGLRSRDRINPRPTRFVSGKAGECRWRPRRYQVDPWSRGENLPAASYALLPNLKKGLFLAIGEGSSFFVACFVHSSAQMCLFQTPGQRPPSITGHFVKTVTRGWVGAPNERAPCRFMAQSLVLSIDVCPRLGISPLRTNIWLSCSQADLGPRSAQELLFSGFLNSLKLFFEDLCS